MLRPGLEDRARRFGAIAAARPALFHPHGLLPPNLPPRSTIGILAFHPFHTDAMGLPWPEPSDWPQNALQLREGARRAHCATRRVLIRSMCSAARPAGQRARAGLGRGKGGASRGCPRRLPAFPEYAHDRSRHHLRRLHGAPERACGHARCSRRSPTTGDWLGCPRVRQERHRAAGGHGVSGHPIIPNWGKLGDP